MNDVASDQIDTASKKPVRPKHTCPVCKRRLSYKQFPERDGPCLKCRRRQGLTIDDYIRNPARKPQGEA
jgi:hypothetical protein